MILEYKGINISFSDQGKGTAVVLLHGFLESSKIWEPFLSDLSKKNRVICIDLLGHGETECIGYIHTMELMADAVKAILQHLKIRKSIFIGHSMGGYVALAYAEKNPDALKGLCLMNSTASADTIVKKQNRDRAIIAVKQNHKTFIRLAITNLFSPKNRSVFSKEIEALISEALKTPLQGIIAALEGMKIRQNREVLLHFTPFKKMMIIGKEDSALDSELLKMQIKNTDVVVVEFQDGHMSFIENKEYFLREIVIFIEKI